MNTSVLIVSPARIHCNKYIPCRHHLNSKLGICEFRRYKPAPGIQQYVCGNPYVNGFHTSNLKIVARPEGRRLRVSDFSKIVNSTRRGILQNNGKFDNLTVLAG